jgi:hypothetical protein
MPEVFQNTDVPQTGQKKLWNVPPASVGRENSVISPAMLADPTG